MLICAATIGYVFNLKMDSSSPQSHDHSSIFGDIMMTKLFSIIINFAFSFLNFMQAQRFCNHVGFLLHVHEFHAESTSHIPEHPVSPDLAVAFLERAFLHQFLGMRCFFIAIPLAAWIFGPITLLLSTFCLLAWLRYLDTDEALRDYERPGTLREGATITGHRGAPDSAAGELCSESEHAGLRAGVAVAIR